MRLSASVLAMASLLALAPLANAGGLDDAQADDTVIAPADDDDGAAAFSLGGLGTGGAIVIGALLAGAIAAGSSSNSGSH